MLERLRSRSTDESGFTLVELLVVMLIIGILAAIAIPSFFAQRDKATDTDAKSAARTAQTAIETYATDNSGSYASATPADLETIEATLDATQLTVVSTADTYTVTADSDTGNTFSIARLANGDTSLTCTGSGGGCNGGTW
jgi:type IV pilus assembly protein PilA